MDKVRSRATNFTPEETDTLLNLMGEYKDIVECKKTDQTTNSAKERAWEQLTEKFNSRIAGGRSAKHLRSKWDALKKTTRKEYAILNKNNNNINGSPADCSSGLSMRGQRVFAIVGLSVNGSINNVEDESEMEISEEDPLLISFKEEIEPENADKPSSSEWTLWTAPLSEQSPNRALSFTPNETEPQTEPEINQHVGALKRTRTTNRQSRTLQRKQSEKKIFELLATKKIELVEMQMEILKREAEEKSRMNLAKEQREKECHELQILILKKELLLKEKQLKT